MIFAVSLRTVIFFLFFFFSSPANDFPSLGLLVKKVLPLHVEILTTNFNNFINITVPLQCSACFSNPEAPRMAQYSTWASPWKDSLKEHGCLEFFSRWLNAGSRTLTFLKTSQRVWKKLDLACLRMCRVAPASLLPQPSGNGYSSHLGCVATMCSVCMPCLMADTFSR